MISPAARVVVEDTLSHGSLQIDAIMSIQCRSRCNAARMSCTNKIRNCSFCKRIVDTHHNGIGDDFLIMPCKCVFVSKMYH